MKNIIIYHINFVCIFFCTLFVNAQQKSIKLGQSKIGINQYFTITIKVANDRLKSHSPFPDISGFIKRGTSSTSSTNITNGKVTSSQSLTQNYQATKQGKFRLPAFAMLINKEKVTTTGAIIEVGKAIQQRSARNSFGVSPFDDLFGKKNKQSNDFLDVKADAFLATSLDKPEIYVGEGFTVTLAFYVANANRAEMRFYDLSKQVADIIKKIKPKNCWEENFPIEQISGQPVTIRGKNYTQYKIHQTTYYPFNSGKIPFPSVGLKMIKYKVAKNPTFFGRNRQEDYQTFYSKEKILKIKDLPPHPLKEKVAVGDYRLDEKINTNHVKTGASINYQFNIKGEGNLGAIEAPMPIDKQGNFEFYEPNVVQNVYRNGGKVRGIKRFDFYMIPKEPGKYSLDDYFSWIYFNPIKEVYDTLKSQVVLNVSGESHKNFSIATNDLRGFYHQIDQADNRLIPRNNYLFSKLSINVFVLIVFTLSLALIVIKKLQLFK